jgi:hypothetical protein
MALLETTENTHDAANLLDLERSLSWDHIFLEIGSEVGRSILAYQSVLLAFCTIIVSGWFIQLVSSSFFV